MKIIFSYKAEKQFLKLDKSVQKQIQTFISKLKGLENPRLRGKALVGNLLGLWRYRVGDYRLLCKILDEELFIVVVDVGHRKRFMTQIKILETFKSSLPSKAVLHRLQYNKPTDLRWFVYDVDRSLICCTVLKFLFSVNQVLLQNQSI